MARKFWSTRITKYNLKTARIILAISFATLAMLLIRAFLANLRTQAAPSIESTGSNPCIRTITLTADIPIYDTHPGDGASKTVYFNNMTTGALTLTFEITGTPMLTLTAGTAFGSKLRVYTSTATSWQPIVTYSVRSNSGNFPGVRYTVVNANNQSANVFITYTKDINAPSVTVTAPHHITATAFIISWHGTDPLPSSGLIPSYTVAYRANHGSWHTWYSSTLKSSETFTDAQLGFVYDFRVTAYDRVGNSSSGVATTLVGPLHLYLPLAMRQWASWYQYDNYEPNNVPDHAYGPLISGQIYRAYMWNLSDQNDYYHFTTSTSINVQISLANIPSNCDYDLFVYYYAGQYYLQAYSNQPGNTSENVAFTSVTGRKYYIRVYQYSGFSNQQPYHLKVIYQ